MCAVWPDLPNFATLQYFIKGSSITVQLYLLFDWFRFSWFAYQQIWYRFTNLAESKPVKQEVSRTLILPLCTDFGHFDWVHLAFGKFLSLLWLNFYAIGHVFIIANGQISKTIHTEQHKSGFGSSSTGANSMKLLQILRKILWTIYARNVRLPLV